jgi:hypothetical protein
MPRRTGAHDAHAVMRSDPCVIKLTRRQKQARLAMMSTSSARDGSPLLVSERWP